MRVILAAVAVVCLAGCPTPPPPNPPPQPPDASDASPGILDAYAVPDAPVTPCEAACAALRAAGCHTGSAPNCVADMAHIDGSRLVREPGNGLPLTCADVAAAKTPADVRALGLGCP